MHHDDLSFLADLVKRQSGVQVSTDRSYLFESRLLPVARQFGHSGLDGLARALRGSCDPKLADAVVEAMTTNESFFFRDQHPFDQFRRFMLPELRKARAGDRCLRIWSAAASTGQEPYSLAMCLEEAGEEFRSWRIEILATDISSEALEKGREGIYSQFEVQRGLSVQMMVKYFDQDGTKWKVKDCLGKRISFAKHNLMKSNRALGKFDIIFLRNVLIYFDLETKKRILEEVASMLRDPGFLCLGGTESVIGVTSALKAVDGRRGVFVPDAYEGPERRSVREGGSRPERWGSNRLVNASGMPALSPGLSRSGGTT
ncbi:MAG: protein-glutamate O-methyltransferase CheR [Geminicoccaceae bacterium]|nr:protein-glutamate O-methyltransferase CheR [Geminicoccaceae bacterium]